MDEKIKILIVSDALIARAMLKRLIEEEDDMVVVDEESTGQGGIIMLDEVNPDVVMLEVAIGGGMKLENIIKQMLAMDENVKIILCADTRHSHLVSQVADAGAMDLITRPYRKETVLRVIREVARGDITIEF